MHWNFNSSVDNLWALFWYIKLKSVSYSFDLQLPEPLWLILSWVLCCWCFAFLCLDKPALDRQTFGQNWNLNEQFALDGRFLILPKISDSISSSFSNISASIMIRKHRGHARRENRSGLNPFLLFFMP